MKALVFKMVNSKGARCVSREVRSVTNMCVSCAGFFLFSLVDLFVADVHYVPSAFRMITIPVSFQRLNVEPEICVHQSLEL